MSHRSLKINLVSLGGHGPRPAFFCSIPTTTLNIWSNYRLKIYFPMEFTDYGHFEDTFYAQGERENGLECSATNVVLTLVKNLSLQIFISVEK